MVLDENVEIIFQSVIMQCTVICEWMHGWMDGSSGSKRELGTFQLTMSRNGVQLKGHGIKHMDTNG